MTHHTRDEQTFYRDLVIAFWSPRFVVGDRDDPVRWIACAEADTVEVRR